MTKLELEDLKKRLIDGQHVRFRYNWEEYFLTNEKNGNEMNFLFLTHCGRTRVEHSFHDKDHGKLVTRILNAKLFNGTSLNSNYRLIDIVSYD